MTMAASERRQTGWWGGISNLSSGILNSAMKRRAEETSQPIPVEPIKQTVMQPREAATTTHRDTPRPRVTFQEVSATSPESPFQRATAAQLATRKILERPLGPSSKLTTNTVRATNFSAAAAPRPMFRATVTSESNKFTFSSPRATPINPLRDTFRPSASANKSLKDTFLPAPTTPSRDLRASTMPASGRGVSRTPVSELFSMKIPEPPAHLTGEEIAKKIPNNTNRIGSIYADEFLADLCPKDFNETQRKQFFCILDLRRLKYASDEIYVKKDWRVNILNFAKEYEKSRSLIMLRYGLYEFKSIKPSQEVVSKWKASHGIPDSDDDAAHKTPTTAARPNGTEGILSRASTKRKAQEELPKPAERVAAPQNKRARGVEREPLTETATPTLNKNSRKRTVEDVEDEENPPAKVSRQTSSATKKFFEQVANSKPSQPVSPSTFGLPSEVSRTKTTAFSPSSFTPTTNGIMNPKPVLGTTSNVTSGSSKLSAPTNIFAHLSDTGSAQASGNENDAGDEDDSEEEESEAHEVSQSDEPSVAASGGVETPRPAGALFSTNKQPGTYGLSSTSSEAGEAAAPGPSIFERLTKGDDGKPKRLLPQEDGGIGSLSASQGASESERAASPVKEQGVVNKTWSPDTPIKFAPTQPTASAFASMTPKASLGLGSATVSITTPAAAPKMFNFGPQATTGSTAQAPKFGSGLSSGTFGASVNGTNPTNFGGIGKKDETKPAAEPATTPVPNALAAQAKSSSSVFGAPAAPVKKADNFKSAAPQATLFGSGGGATPSGFAPSGQASQTSANSTLSPVSTFGAATAAPSTQETPNPAFACSSGSAPSGSKPLFGLQPGQESSAPTFGLISTKPPNAFGSFSEKNAKPLFGLAPGQDSAKPTFGLGPDAGAAKDLQAVPSFSLGAAKDSSGAKPLFGLAPAQDGGATPSRLGSEQNKASTTNQPLFGSGSGLAAPATAATSFGSFKPTLAPQSGKDASTSEPPKSSVLFGNSTPAAIAAKDSVAESKPLFGSGTSTPAPTSQAPAFSFGSAAAAPSEPPKASTSIFGAGTSGASPSFGFGAQNGGSAPSFMFGGGQGGSTTPAAPASTTPGQTLFGGGIGGAPSGFNFSAGGPGSQAFNNPFTAASGGGSSAGPVTFNFGGGSSQPAAGAAPPGGMFNFSSGATTPANGASTGASTSMFNFGGGSSQPNGTPTSNQQPSAASSIFANLAPPMGGTSTGTNTPFTFGGASSLATTPANGTPEPGATDRSDHDGQKTDGDEQPQEQINLTEGGPGEEDEDVVYEVRTKALKLVTAKDSSDEDSAAGGKEKKSPWKTMGVGPFRLLKHKSTSAVRMLLRGEPRGHIVLNKSVLPGFSYKPEKGDKYVKLTTASDDGKGLETWMIQVKDAPKGQALAAALEEHKKANAKKD